MLVFERRAAALDVDDQESLQLLDEQQRVRHLSEIRRTVRVAQFLAAQRVAVQVLVIPEQVDAPAARTADQKEPAIGHRQIPSSVAATGDWIDIDSGGCLRS